METSLTVFEHSNEEGLICFLIPPVCGDFSMEGLRDPHVSFTTKTPVTRYSEHTLTLQEESPGTTDRMCRLAGPLPLRASEHHGEH